MEKGLNLVEKLSTIGYVTIFRSGLAWARGSFLEIRFARPTVRKLLPRSFLFYKSRVPEKKYFEFQSSFFGLYETHNSQSRKGPYHPDHGRYRATTLNSLSRTLGLRSTTVRSCSIITTGRLHGEPSYKSGTLGHKYLRQLKLPARRYLFTEYSLNLLHYNTERI